MLQNWLWQFCVLRLFQNNSLHTVGVEPGSCVCLLEKLGGFRCIWLMPLLLALCDVKFRQIEGNGLNIRHIGLDNLLQLNVLLQYSITILYLLFPEQYESLEPVNCAGHPNCLTLVDQHGHCLRHKSKQDYGIFSHLYRKEIKITEYFVNCTGHCLRYKPNQDNGIFYICTGKFHNRLIQIKMLEYFVICTKTAATAL